MVKNQRVLGGKLAYGLLGCIKDVKHPLLSILHVHRFKITSVFLMTISLSWFSMYKLYLVLLFIIFLSSFVSCKLWYEFHPLSNTKGF